jgi:hypothetical protein
VRPLHRRLAVALAIAIASPCIVPSVDARADAEADAKDLFAKGRELRTAGNCKDALQYFRKAVKLFPSGLGSLRNLAECEEQLSMWASAHRDWLDLKRQLLTNTDAKYQGWDAEAEAAANRDAPKVSKLTVALVMKGSQDPVDTSTFVVSINGEVIDHRLVGTELDRDPGTYEIKVGGGKDEETASVTLGVADSQKITIPVEPKVLLQDVSTTVVKTDEIRDRNATMRTIGYASMGVGAAAVGGVIVALVVRGSALSDLKSACPNYDTQPCSSKVDSTVSKGKTASLLVDVFGGVAILAIGFGFTIVVTHPAPEEQKSTTTTVTLSPVPMWGGGGAALSGSF